MKNLISLCTLFIFASAFSQTKNFIDQPYLETSEKADSLVTPDRIYLNIIISEKDTKDRKSVEELENLMEQKLKSLGINTQKQLTLDDLASNFKKYFLKGTDILKTKSYNLLVYDAKTAGNVIAELENADISNVNLVKTEHSNANNIIRDLKAKAIAKARNNAIYMAKSINQKIGGALFISDLETGFIPMNNNMPEIMMMRSTAKTADARPIDIEFKKIKFEAAVSVKFKLE